MPGRIDPMTPSSPRARAPSRVAAESASAAGVRRVEALAGPAARGFLEDQDRRVQAAAAALRARPDDIVARIEALIEEKRKLERELAETRKQLALGGGQGGGDGASEVNGVKFLVIRTKDIDNNQLKGLVDDGKQRLGSGIVAVANASCEGRLALIVGVTADLAGRFSAVELVKAGAAAAGGKGGGGRPDMAQAGGPDAAKTEDALAAIRAALGG